MLMDAAECWADLEIVVSISKLSDPSAPSAPSAP